MDGFWEHYCMVEKDIMGFEKGVKCDWCGIKIVVRNDDERLEEE